MGNSSHEEDETSDSDIEECSETVYQNFERGKYKVTVKGKLRCPFCPGKKKQDYKYDELLAHANGVSKGSSKKRSKKKANHLGLAKYLRKNRAGDVEPVPRPPVLPLNDSVAERDEVYVFPFMGIIVNPLKENDDKEDLLQSSYWLEKLNRFEPNEVNAFWVEEDSIVVVIAKFDDKLTGFTSVTEFEKEFENKGCSKKEWTEKRGDSESKAYGWCARAEDFHSEGPIGEYLSKKGKLSTISDIFKEKAQGQNRIVHNIINTIERSNEDLSKLRDSCEKKAMSTEMVLDARENFRKAIEDGRKKIRNKFLLSFERIIAEKEAQRKDLCTKMEKLDAWSKQLDEMDEESSVEAENKIRLMNDDMMSVQMASHELGKADKSMLKLVENHKMRRKEAVNKMLQFEKQQDIKQALEMKIQELKENLQVMKGDNDSEAAKQKIKEITDNLEEKKSELEGLEQMNLDLMTKERQSNYEIQAARKLLIAGLISRVDAQTDIGIKLMGKLDEKPFLNVCKKTYSANEVTAEADTLRSKWQEKLEDSAWQTFKREGTGDKAKKVVDEKDEQLKKLKTALEEMKEYGSGVHELWNFKEKRKATVKEVFTFISNDVSKRRRT